MKTKIILLFSAVALLCACYPEEIGRYDFSNYTLDKVVCYASSTTLAADNTSQLDLQVAIYSEVGKYTDKYGQQRTRYMEVPRDRWREHDIKFYVNGAQVTPPYKTGSTSPATLQCYAEVDGVRSSQSPAKMAALYQQFYSGNTNVGTPPEYDADPTPFFFEVAVVEPYEMPARRIPVIFHIIDSEQNKSMQQVLEASVCMRIIERWNAAFVDANLEFVPAVKNASGVKLDEPGINRVYVAVSSNEMADAINDTQLWLWGASRYTEPTNNQSMQMSANGYLWLVNNGKLPASFTPVAYYNNSRYLNVWILSDDMLSSDISSTFNRYQFIAREYLPTVFPADVYVEDVLPLRLPAMVESRVRKLDAAQMAMWNANPGNLNLPGIPGTTNTLPNKIKSLRQVGMLFPKSYVANYGIDVVTPMGAFFGLIPNPPKSNDEQWQSPFSGSSAWIDDLCSDTPVYDMWYFSAQKGGMEPVVDGNSRVKYTTAAPYYVYNSTNVMEYASVQTTITPQQLERMDWVLKNAPGRMMWKDLTAITE